MSFLRISPLRNVKKTLYLGCRGYHKRITSNRIMMKARYY
nr:MAG TPA: hypothetical protein [Caudoviricetes sp.]DAQ94475.1 MAG TPA: hypothetical protein [Caudoviricetes sp.]